MRFLSVTVLAFLVCASCSHPQLNKPDGEPFYDGDGGTNDGQTAGDDGAVSADDQIVTGDDGIEPADQAPDTTPPCLLNAFSPGEGIIAARFSEPVDPRSAADVSNYTVRGSSGDTVNLVSAAVDGIYVRLQVAPGTTFIAGTTYNMLVRNVKDLAGNVISSTCNRADSIKRTLYLNIIWHQHQPLYLEPVSDQLLSPWVRKHATKDYYDMAAMLADYPKIHVNINLTSVLIHQLITYYLERLGPYVDVKNNRVDAEAFLAKWEGKTDPWIDLLLKPTPDPSTVSEKELGLLHKDAWSCVSTSDAMMKRFPEYRELRDKPRSTYTREDFLNLKGWFEIAWFDPDFLRGAVRLPNGWVVDLSDVVEQRADGTFWLRRPITEELCNRLVAEEYKIMANVIPAHVNLMYRPAEKTGQIEILTTPYYHPILPLLVDTNLARQQQPWDRLPDPPFKFPEDAHAQVAKSTKFYRNVFGIDPWGMWPGEGSVAEEVVQYFVDNNIRWVATGQQVLRNSNSSAKHWFPYRVDVDRVSGDAGSHDDEMMIVFRDDGLSNEIGFRYQSMTGPEAAASFMANVVAQAPALGEPDRLLTVILDGENAWENYVRDHDAKDFLKNLYQSLERAFDAGEVVTVTGSEYITGNPARNVPEHPISAMRELEPLSAGSWIDGSFSIWIGEPEENLAWGCLLRTRQDVERSGIPRFNPLADPPTDTNSYEYNVYKVWEEIYAAEGSDWFWWFGLDMITPANDDTPFDRGFRAHLSGVYAYLKKIKPDTVESICPVIIQESGKTPKGPFTAGAEPNIDGIFVPNEAEWINEGGFYNDSDSGSMGNPDDDIARVYYGYTQQHFYLALEANEDLSQKPAANYRLEIYFPHKHIIDLQTGQTQKDPANPRSRSGSELFFKIGGAARLLEITTNPPAHRFFRADGNGGWVEEGSKNTVIAGPGSGGQILEMKIPYTDLNLTFGDPLEVIVIAVEGGRDIDLAPNTGSQVIFEDATNVVKVMFVVDVSGQKVPRDAYGSCCDTPPPPDGNGIVYIAGNLPVLGAEGDKWVPNVVSLRDDGQGGDEVASDRKWTLIIDAQRGETIKYKYTIGLPSDEGRWYGTEEYPVTYRGIEVVGADPTKKLKKLIVRDVFADKPTGGRDGYPGSMTVFEYEYEQ